MRLPRRGLECRYTGEVGRVCGESFGIKMDSTVLKYYSPFKPYRACTAGEEIEMAQNGSSTVLVIQELVHEQVDSRSERVNGEVSDILGKYEQREGRTERQVHKGRLN